MTEELKIAADYIMWTGDANTFRIAGNHQPTEAANQPASAWPEFDPDSPQGRGARNRPRGSNVVRLDARVEWHDFGELLVYRYIVDYTPHVHTW